MMEVLPDPKTGRFSMEACLANQLVARLINEILALEKVAQAA
jgi:hypothetical protein